jgi:molybdopterin converting factor small subunit
MITVCVRSVGGLRTLLGGGDLDVALPEDSRVEDLLERLAADGGQSLADQLAAVADSRSVPLALRVLVNGRDIGALEGVMTALADGDDVLIMTPLAGG